MPWVWVWCKEVRDRIVSVAVTGVLLMCVCVISGVLWGPMQVQFAAVRDLLPPAVLALVPGDDMSTPAGWVNAQVMSLSAPGGLIVVGVIAALRASVGEEDRGTMALLLGNGISRRGFVVAKFAAMLTVVAMTAVLLAFGLVFADTVWGLGLGLGPVVVATAHALALAWWVGALTLLLGLATGRARVSAMVGSGVAAAAFLVATFFPLSPALAGWDRLSPWYYFADVDALNGGKNFSHLIVLLGSAFIILLFSYTAFNRRDLRN